MANAMDKQGDTEEDQGRPRKTKGCRVEIYRGIPREYIWVYLGGGGKNKAPAPLRYRVSRLLPIFSKSDPQKPKVEANTA